MIIFNFAWANLSEFSYNDTKVLTTCCSIKSIGTHTAESCEVPQQNINKGDFQKNEVKV